MPFWRTVISTIADLPGRISRLAQRIGDVRGGAGAQALEPWMEELYRRVSDRQTMGSVVQELRASLSEVEKQIDQYFRNPVQRELLIPVPNQLSSMRGVLSVLGMDQASAAVLHMRDDVDALASTEVDPQQAIRAGTFDRLADNMGALSFLIDMLSVQPQLAKSLFRYDAQQGTLSAVMGQSERPSVFGGLDDVLVPAAPELVDQTLSLAKTIRQPQSGEDVTQRLEELSEKAEAADQPALLDAIRSAQTELQSAPDEQSRAAVRSDLAAKITDIVAQPATVEPAPPHASDSRRRSPRLSEAPGSKTTRRCAKSSSKRRARSSKRPAVHWPIWSTCRTTWANSPACAAPSTPSRAVPGWWVSALSVKPPGPANSCTTRGWLRHRSSIRRCATSPVKRWATWPGGPKRRPLEPPAGHSSPPVVQSADALRLHAQRVPIAALAAPTLVAKPVAAAPSGDLAGARSPDHSGTTTPRAGCAGSAAAVSGSRRASVSTKPRRCLCRTVRPNRSRWCPACPICRARSTSTWHRWPARRTRPVKKVSFELDLGDGGNWRRQCAALR
jgi:hypothetical protein